MVNGNERVMSRQAGQMRRNKEKRGHFVLLWLTRDKILFVSHGYLHRCRGSKID